MSTESLESNCWRIRSNAIKVPVLPTPALEEISKEAEPFFFKLVFKVYIQRLSTTFLFSSKLWENIGILFLHVHSQRNTA